MMNRLNAISTSLNTILSEIANLNRDLIDTADSQKANLLEILAQLGATRSTMRGLSSLCESAGAALLDVSEACDEVVDKVDETLDWVDGIPVGSYSTFVGFCENCGVELHVSDSYEHIDNYEVLCTKCAIPDTVVVTPLIVDEDASAETDAVVADEVTING